VVVERRGGRPSTLRWHDGQCCCGWEVGGCREGGGRHRQMTLGWESSCRHVVAVCAGDVGGRVTAINAGDGGGVVVVVSVDGHVNDIDGGGRRHWWPRQRRWWWGHHCPCVGGGRRCWWGSSGGGLAVIVVI